MKERLKDGYINYTVLLIITLIMSILSTALISISYHLSRSNKYSNVNKTIAIMLETLKDITDEIEKTDSEEYTGLESGWISLLPLDKDGCSVEYEIIDNKIPINWIDLDNLPTYIMKESFDSNTSFFYNQEDIIKYIKDEYADAFSCSMMYNLNICDVEKIGDYISRLSLGYDISDELKQKIMLYRGSLNYWKHNDLIVNETRYELLKIYFPRGLEEDLYKYFDFKGSINLNFVSESVFRLCLEMLYNSDDINVEELWQNIMVKQNSGIPIKSIEEIFGNRSSSASKCFCVDTSLIGVRLEKDMYYVGAVFRKYKDAGGNNRVLLLETMAGEL